MRGGSSSGQWGRKVVKHVIVTRNVHTCIIIEALIPEVTRGYSPQVRAITFFDPCYCFLCNIKCVGGRRTLYYCMCITVIAKTFALRIYCECCSFPEYQ